MREKLFLDNDINVDCGYENAKTASISRLGADPNEWAGQILSVALEKHPYLSNFDLTVNLTDIDDEGSYAFGHVSVKQKSDNPVNPVKLKIPVIVRNRNLSKFDVMVCEQGYKPLTEWRLEELMMDPATFDVASKGPSTDSGGMTNLERLLDPPDRYEKTASIIDAIKYTIDESKLLDFKDDISDPDIPWSTVSEDVKSEIRKLAFLDAEDLHKKSIIEKVAEQITEPKVLQVFRNNGKYAARTSDPDAFFVQEFPATKLANFAEIKSECDKNGGILTISSEAIVRSDPQPKHMMNKMAGLWDVQLDDKSEISGIGVPVYNFTGDKTNSTLFTDGNSYSIAEKPVGRFIGKLDHVKMAEFGLDEPVSGSKNVLISSGEYGTKCTPPFLVKGKTKLADSETSFIVDVGDGIDRQLSPTDDLRQIVIDGNNFSYPSSMKFIPLGREVKLASYSSDTSLEVIPADGEYSVRTTLDIPDDWKYRLTSDEVEFILANVGVSPEFAREKLAEADSSKKKAVFYGVRNLGNFEKLAHDIISAFPKLNIETELLVKEAAMINDADTADKILSLGFINPENIMVFASYRGDIDKALSRLCELVLAARLGLREISESALEKTISLMDSVVLGLKQISDYPVSDQPENLDV